MTLKLNSSYNEQDILNGIRKAVAGKKNGDTITSDEIINCIRGREEYTPDYKTPAGSSVNALLGKDIKAVGEAYGILEEVDKVYKSGTTLTKYKIHTVNF